MASDLFINVNNGQDFVVLNSTRTHNNTGTYVTSSSIHPSPCFYLSSLLLCRAEMGCIDRLGGPGLEGNWEQDGRMCLRLIALCQIYGNALFGFRLMLLVVNRTGGLWTMNLNNSRAFVHSASLLLRIDISGAHVHLTTTTT